MMNRIPYILIIMLCGILLSCASSKTPSHISEHFWLGIKTKNIALVKKYSLHSSIDSTEDLAAIEKVSDVSFGKIIIDGDVSEIETTVSLLIDEKNIEVKLKTYLEKNNDAWKVNYRKTMLPLLVNQNMAEMFEGIEAMTEEVTEQIEESVKEIQDKVVPQIKSELEDLQEKVVPEIESTIEQAEKKLIENLPKFKNIFDDILRSLEESLKEMVPVEEEQPKTQET